MERLQPRATPVLPVFALTLALCSAAFFGVAALVGIRSIAAENVYAMTWVLGWVLLIWAALLSGGYAVLLSARMFSHRPVSKREVAFVAAALALPAIVLVAQLT